jgi:hypothetical protein
MKKLPDIEVAKKMINLQQSASSRNIEYDLSFETVKCLMTRTHCYYTGIKFEDEGKLSFSVDRVDSKKGYIEGNVVACTVDINSKKSNLTIEEIKSLSTRIDEFYNKQKKSIAKRVKSFEEKYPLVEEEKINNEIEQKQERKSNNRIRN